MGLAGQGCLDGIPPVSCHLAEPWVPSPRQCGSEWPCFREVSAGAGDQRWGPVRRRLGAAGAPLPRAPPRDARRGPCRPGSVAARLCCGRRWRLHRLSCISVQTGGRVDTKSSLSCVPVSRRRSVGIRLPQAVVRRGEGQGCGPRSAASSRTRPACSPLPGLGSEMARGLALLASGGSCSGRSWAVLLAQVLPVSSASAGSCVALPRLRVEH